MIWFWIITTTLSTGKYKSAVANYRFIQNLIRSSTLQFTQNRRLNWRQFSINNSGKTWIFPNTYVKAYVTQQQKLIRVLRMRKTFTHITKESFLILYKSYVRPHLKSSEGGTSVYERKYKGPQKIVPEFANLSDEERLLKYHLILLLLRIEESVVISLKSIQF